MTAVYKLWIPGRLPGLNAVIDANRCNIYKGATLKKRADEAVRVAVREAGNFTPLDGCYHWRFTWRCENQRRDPDNIASACKFVFDGLQHTGIITNDGWATVRSIEHRFECDAPGVLVEVLK